MRRCHEISWFDDEGCSSRGLGNNKLAVYGLARDRWGCFALSVGCFLRLHNFVPTPPRLFFEAGVVGVARWPGCCC